MRIGINLLYLLPKIVGGTETYASGLLGGLAEINKEDEFIIFVNVEAARWPIPYAPNMMRIVCPVRATSRAWRYYFEQVHLPGLLKKHNIDVVHSLGYVSPLLAPCPAIVTVPDLNFEALGSQMALSRRILLRMVVSMSVKRAKKVITISEFSRQQIMSKYKFRPEKTVVTHLATRSRDGLSMGLENGQTLRQFGITKPYMVAFSSQSPHKNIDRLVDAFVVAQKKYDLKHHLVLIGHAPPGWPAKYMPPEVHATGWIEDPVVTSILIQAEMLVFPSVYEGFGLPVLEAMDIGTPVVCSRAASLPEVTGQAALLFDPLRVEDIAEKIATTASDPKLREELRQKGFENIHTRFSWDKTAEETMRVYREVAAMDIS